MCAFHSQIMVHPHLGKWKLGSQYRKQREVGQQWPYRRNRPTTDSLHLICVVCRVDINKMEVAVEVDASLMKTFCKMYEQMMLTYIRTIT